MSARWRYRHDCGGAGGRPGAAFTSDLIVCSPREVRPSLAGGHWLRPGTGVNQQTFFVPDRVAWNPVLAPTFTVDEISVLQVALGND